MKCPRCGAENPPGMIFCQECGFRLAEVVLHKQQNPCLSCGFVNEPAMRFCLQCGAPVAAPPLRAALPPTEGWTCAHCGQGNRSGYSFCGQCGQPRVVAPPSWTCAHCGQGNRAGYSFCGQCGQPRALAAPSPRRPAPTPTAPEPKRGWRRFAMYYLAGFLVVAVCMAVVAFVFLRPKAMDRDDAILAADRIVAQSFPEYAGTKKTVSDWVYDDGDTAYAISYSYELQIDGEEPMQRILVLYVDSDSGRIRVEETN